MKKLIIFLLLITGFSVFNKSHADEGMWIPILLEQLNEDEMISMGMEITAEDIYNINHSSMKDAIVRFGRGCTGVVVSEQGLLLTNHHCGFGSIQRHSSLENDYLTDGFWAMDMSEELPNPGLTVTFIVKMEDVTAQVLENINKSLTEAEREQIIQENIDDVISHATDNSYYEAQIRPFYHGNKYYMIITETYEDVRLVGAPPSNIGKFGGDTDNWMWPRHTGDFSIFRIYADSNNKPAPYSENNVPFKPKYDIPISIAGIDEGDFTLVFGFPGRTFEYLPSIAVEKRTEVRNPAIIDLRQKRINIMNDYMNDYKLVRIQYASKLARVANYWKKFIGENRGIKKLNGIAKKQKLENEFQQWADADPDRKKKYEGILPEFKMIYEYLAPYQRAYEYVTEGGFGIEIVGFAGNFRGLVESSQMDTNKLFLDLAIVRLKNNTRNHFKNYHLPIDKEAMEQILRMYDQNLPEEYKPDVFIEIHEKFDNNYKEYTDWVFNKSIFTSEEKTIDFLNNYKKKHYKKIEKDPAYKIAVSLRDLYFNKLQGPLTQHDTKLDSLQRLYMKGLMEFQQDKRFYPDANSTLRVHYGKVDGFSPRDAVDYNYYTTLTGIMEKENPDIYDYVVEDKLKELYRNKNYGDYADKDGTMHVCFLGTNHTTGGNSGSPVFNAKGELIGLNFDRAWESTMSDLMYDPDQCRNITLDIRYLLFIVDKFAGARHLVDEMSIVGK